MVAPTVLIPVEFPDPDPLPSTFIDGLTACKVVLLGAYELSPDVDPDDRQRKEVEAYHTLYTLANQFVRRGETAEVELVMGEDVTDAQTTVADERDVDALLVPNPITTFGRVMVALRGETFREPVTDLVSALDTDVLLHTTLFHVAEDEADVEDGKEMLTTVRDHLVDKGFPRTRVDTEVVVSDDPSFEIGQAMRDYDLLVMGETQESPLERVFGRTYESIAEQTHRPIIVVQE